LNSGREKTDSNAVMSKLVSLLLEQHSAGQVHSTFRCGLNVEFNGSLVYFGCCGTPLTAFGMNIEREKINHLLETLQSDDLVVNKGDRLVFYGRAAVIEIGLRGVDEVDLALPRLECQIRDIADTELYRCLANSYFQSAAGLAPALGINGDARTREYVELLIRSDKNDIPTNTKLITFFAGRGQGLTPSGDDILLGFTVALLLFGRFSAWREVLAAEINPKRTTMISTAYVKSLLKGYVSEPLLRLVRLLDGSEMAEVEAAVREVRAFGHTSGEDTLFGFSLGLKFLVRKGKDTDRE